MTQSGHDAGSCLRNTDERSDGRMGCPLCATYPHHRGLMQGYPVAIQSFHLLSAERAGNSAQRGIPTLTGKRKGRLPRAFQPLLITGLSPGLPLRHTVQQGVPVYMLVDRQGVYSGVPRVVYPAYTRRVVYPSYTRVVYSPDTSLYPGGV